MFEIPVVGSILRARSSRSRCQRGTIDAVKALDEAVAAVEAGGCVIVYPEGTTTKEPDLWPMRGKTGAARLWLATGAPVVPIVHVGSGAAVRPAYPQAAPGAAHPGDRRRRAAARPVPRGPARARPRPTLQEITDFIMLTLRDMLVEIRGGTPPPLWSRPATGHDGHRADRTESEG